MNKDILAKYQTIQLEADLKKSAALRKTFLNIAIICFGVSLIMLWAIIK